MSTPEFYMIFRNVSIVRVVSICLKQIETDTKTPDAKQNYLVDRNHQWIKLKSVYWLASIGSDDYMRDNGS